MKTQAAVKKKKKAKQTVKKASKPNGTLEDKPYLDGRLCAEIAFALTRLGYLVSVFAQVHFRNLEVKFLIEKEQEGFIQLLRDHGAKGWWSPGDPVVVVPAEELSWLLKLLTGIKEGAVYGGLMEIIPRARRNH